MTASISIGNDGTGNPVLVDVEELLATRLLVQGNSGSGKSHLLRRLLEESAPMVQQVVIDPEGDFVTLADEYGHVVIDAGDYNEREIVKMAMRIREHRASVVLSLESLELEAQMKCAASFLSTLFDAPRDHWYPALVVVDEAQMFAPVSAGDVSDEARRLSLAAMTNLMCRGRKRGLAGVIATQRLAKLAKNVAAEASNFLMGRTFLDIDMARAADLLGMERRQAEQIRDLERGRFLGLGPAIARRPVAVKIGAVKTGTRGGTHKLMPPPVAATEDLQELLFAKVEEDALPPPPPRAEPLARPAEEIMRALADAPSAKPAAPELDFGQNEPIVIAVLDEIVADLGDSVPSVAALFQDFGVRCRMKGLRTPPLDLPAFRKRFAMAQAGMTDASDPRWEDAMRAAEPLPEDMLAPFLLIARAAMQGTACPDDAVLARAYGTSSPGRVRRLIDYMEKLGVIVARTDFGGRRSIGVPALGLSTAAAEGVSASVLFICLGNICRSPLAEAALRAAAEQAGLDILVDSAGTGAWHVGDAPDPRAQAVARRHGIDISGYRGRQVKPADFRRFTHIFALDSDNLRNLRRMRPTDGIAALSLLMDLVPGRAGSDVTDPYYGDDAGFDITWDDVTRAARAIVARLQA